MATGDDHYTDLASLSMTTSNRANQILMFWYVVTMRSLCGLSGSPGEGGTYPAGFAVMGFDNLVGVGHLFLPPLPQFSFHMTLSGGKLHCILLKSWRGKCDADPLPAVDPLFHRYYVNPVARVLHVAPQPLRGGIKRQFPFFWLRIDSTTHHRSPSLINTSTDDVSINILRATCHAAGGEYYGSRLNSRVGNPPQNKSLRLVINIQPHSSADCNP